MLSALFASCKDEIEDYNEREYVAVNKNGKIGFDLYQDGFQKPTTRSIIENVGQLKNVYVLSMKKTGVGNWEQVFKNNEGNGIDAVTLTNDGPHTVDGEIWDYTKDSPEAEWEDGYQYKFRAFYPESMKTSNGEGEQCGSGGFVYEKNPLTGSTVLTLKDYKSHKTPSSNSDLLVSNEETREYSIDKGNDEVVALDMKHLLAAVNFNIKKKAGTKLTITKFRMKNYVQIADYDGNNWIIPKEDLYSSESELTSLITNFDFRNPDGTIISNVKSSDFKGQGNGGNKQVISSGNFYLTYKNTTNATKILNYSKSFLSKSYASTVTSAENVNLNPLLMIPQPLMGESEVRNIMVNNNKFAIEIKKDNVEAEIEFYFGDTDPGKGNRLIATVDLSANGKVPEWKAGVKYNYTVGIYEYQATADITIEDWTHHTYEEELK